MTSREYIGGWPVGLTVKPVPRCHDCSASPGGEREHRLGCASIGPVYEDVPCLTAVEEDAQRRKRADPSEL
jgi:hypothetical protein